MHFEIGMTIFVFAMTMIVILWRPGGINEAWPASIGAVIILLTGIVSHRDILDIINKIGAHRSPSWQRLSWLSYWKVLDFFTGRLQDLPALQEDRGIACIGTFNYCVFNDPVIQ